MSVIVIFSICVSITKVIIIHASFTIVYYSVYCILSQGIIACLFIICIIVQKKYQKN